MSTLKYALHPGYIISAFDGDRHFITAPQLAYLYGVDIKDCVVWDDSRPETFKGMLWKDFIHLFPKSNGFYPVRGCNHEKEQREG